MNDSHIHPARRYRFRGHTGYVIHPTRHSRHTLLALGHTAHIDPWQDAVMHVHDMAEEAFLLLQGRLKFAVADFLITLQPDELILIRPGVPHAIIGGEGQIEHFGIRAPALNDKQEKGELPRGLKPTYEDSRLVAGEWGFRVPLAKSQHQNCWLIGAGEALFASQYMSLAYLDFPTTAAANAEMGTRHQLHFHRESWEYYLALQGSKTLQIEDRLITIQAGELLEVPPSVEHTLHSRGAPYRGITIRVPLRPGDKVFVER